MKVDITLENLFIVACDENKVHFNYKDGRFVTLVFNSGEEAAHFYFEHEFLNKKAYLYNETLVGIDLIKVILEKSA